jgi:RimJ/RimL family protein N-acetyltransferase
MEPEMSRWLASWPPEVTIEEAAGRIVEAMADIDSGRALHWVVETRDDERVVGWVRITRDGTDPSRGEIGFWVGSSFQGVGFATEAVRAALHAGFELLNLAVIEGGAQPANEASQRVMTRVGMVRSHEREVWAPARQRHELCVFYVIERGSIANSVSLPVTLSRD